MAEKKITNLRVYSEAERKSTRHKVAWSVFFVKFLVLLSARFFYTFIVEFMEVYDSSFVAMAAVISVMELVGLMAPFCGTVCNRYGCERVMVISVLVSGLSTFINGFSDDYGYLMLCRALFGIAKVFLITSSQIFIELIPEKERGRTAGSIEISYGFVSLLGIPLMGFVLDGLGWQWTFYVIGALHIPFAGLLAFMFNRPREAWAAELVAAVVVTNNSAVTETKEDKQHTETMFTVLKKLLSCCLPNEPMLDSATLYRAWGTFLSVFSSIMAMNLLYTNYSTWLVTQYDLTQSRVAQLTFAIGIGEVGGELGVVGLSDRFGLTTFALYSSVAYTAGFVLLWVAALEDSLVFAMCILVLVAFLFECVIVTVMANLASVFPPAPDLYAGFFVFLVTLGFALGAIVAPLVWELGNEKMPMSALFSVGFGCLCIVGNYVVHVNTDRSVPSENLAESTDMNPLWQPAAEKEDQAIEQAHVMVHVD